jgi:hypothetical protein
MRRLIPVILLYSLFSISPHAQTPAPENEPGQPPAGVTGDEERNPATANREPKTDTPDYFIPTEEVSEDQSVAFPVDI